MSFIDCIMANTVLSNNQKDKVIADYEKLLADNLGRFGPVEGPVLAAQKYTETEVERLMLKKINTARHVQHTVDRAINVHGVEAAAYESLRQKAGVLKGALFYKSPVTGAIMRNYEKIGSYIGAQYEQNMRALGDIASKYSSKWAGVTQDVQGFKDVVSEIRGSKTGNSAAAEEANRLSKLFNAIHAEYKEVGGVMGKLVNYFPQRHLVEQMQKLVKSHGGDREKAFAEYLSDNLAMLDRKSMVDPKTGYAYSDKEIAATTREVFDEMLNFGIYDAKVATHRMTAAGGEVAMRKSSSRFFHYKDAESFFHMNSKYGSGDSGLFDNMVDYIQVMSRETTLMRHMGPNADLVALGDVKAAAANGASVQMQITMQGVYDTLAGRNAFGGAVGMITKGVENTQNLLRAVQLGSASIPAMADSFFVGITAKYNGLGATDALAKYLSHLNPLSGSDREMAKMIAFVSHTVNANSLAHARISDVSGTGPARWMSNFVNRSSGLGIMTDAARSALPMQTMGFFHLAKFTKTAFKDLPDEMKLALKRWDIDETGYGHIMQAESFVADAAGASFVRPEDIVSINKDTARNYAAWLYDMGQTASNEPRMLTRAITTGAAMGNAKRGSANRLVTSSFMMYKSYGITIMLNHVLPALQRGATEGKWGRAGAIGVVAPLMAAMTMQVSNLMSGKTTERVDTPDFWRRAYQRSGVMGPFTDFAFGDATSYGNGPLKGALGPMYSLSEDLYNFGMGNAQLAISDSANSHPAKGAARLVQRYTPKLWYTKLLQERLIYDQFNRMADPLYDHRMRGIEQKMLNERGQRYYYGPND